MVILLMVLSDILVYQLGGIASNSLLRANVFILLITCAANWSILMLLLLNAIFFLNPYCVFYCDANTKSCKSYRNTRTNLPSSNISNSIINICRFSPQSFRYMNIVSFSKVFTFSCPSTSYLIIVDSSILYASLVESLMS